MKTIIEYTYRDASNYKQHASVVVDGGLTRADLEPFLGVLGISDDFIPFNLNVGMPELQQMMTSFPSFDDVCTHELDDVDIVADDSERIENAVELMMDGRMLTAAELIQAFQKAHANGWDVSAACERLGLI